MRRVSLKRLRYSLNCSNNLYKKLQKYRIKSLYDNKMGLDGTTSGEVATGVAGSKIIHMGYSGVGIYNP